MLYMSSSFDGGSTENTGLDNGEVTSCKRWQNWLFPRLRSYGTGRL